MFTGIIEEVGIVQSITRGQNSAKLKVMAQKVLNDLKVGDSIAVNGVCLTVTAFSSKGFSADVGSETLERSSFENLKSNDSVNLERAMQMNGRFGGHIVSGHIDGTGKIIKIQKNDIALFFTIQTQKKITDLIVEKGSITIDGISLTVTEVFLTNFTISAIPHTLKKTSLALKKIGDIVNLETDIIGKYVEKLLSVKPELFSEVIKKIENAEKKFSKKSNITKSFLAENGF